MSDFIIKSGDMIQITVTAPAVVPQLAAPIPLTGSSTNLKIGGMAACLQGDELPAAIQGPLMYMSPPFVTPGTGTIKIVLLPTNLTTMTQNGKPVLLKGAMFQAIFTVQSPAMMPTPAGPQPDPVAAKPCTAQFITTNATIKAS